MMKNGLDENTPVAVIENATLPVQRTLTSTVKNVANEFEEHNFKPPCIIMISPSVERIKELSWWENRRQINTD